MIFILTNCDPIKAIFTCYNFTINCGPASFQTDVDVDTSPTIGNSPHSYDVSDNEGDVGVVCSSDIVGIDSYTFATNEIKELVNFPLPM